MIFPNLAEFNNYRDYFENLLSINKASNNSPMSFQFLANKIGWPKSFLPDVLQKRKNLTVSRALEFAKFAKLDLYDTELLLYMTLKDLTSDNLQNFFDTQITKSFNETRYIYTPSYQIKQNAFREIAFWQYIDITRRMPTLDAIKRDVTVLHDLEQSEFDSILHSLQEQKAIKIEKNGVITMLKEALYISQDDETQKSLTENFAESTKLYAKNFSGKKTCQNYLFYVSDREIKIFQGKVFKLINWFIDFINTNPTTKADPEVKMYQLSVNLFPISNKIIADRDQ